MTPSPSSEATAIARCGSQGAAAIRLWPGGAIGEFTGELPLSSLGSCEIEASVGDRLVTRSIAVADRPAPGVDRTLAKLERRVKESGGVVVRAPSTSLRASGDETTLAQSIAASAAPAAVVTNVHPMRAAWWILPFAGCLSIEWWLRRRAGLR